jgi:hypothetical protein
MKINMKIKKLTIENARDGMIVTKIGSNKEGSWDLRAYGYKWKIESRISGNRIKLPADQFAQWAIISDAPKKRPVTADDAYKVYQDAAAAATAAARELSEAYVVAHMFAYWVSQAMIALGQASQKESINMLPAALSMASAVSAVSSRITQMSVCAESALAAAIEAADSAGSAALAKPKALIKVCYDHARARQRVVETSALKAEELALEILELVRLEKAKHGNPGDKEQQS